MRKLLLVTTVALAAVAMSPVSRASVLFSDDFNGDATGLSTTPSGWTLTQGNVDIIGAGTPYDYYSGNGHYIDLNGSTYGGIATVQTFDPGTYYVTFNLGSSVGGAGGVDAASTPKLTEVCLGNSSCVTISLPSTPADWTSQAFSFTTTVVGSLSFASLKDNSNTSFAQDVGNILDNVVVNSTPLPSTWTMLIAGFAGLGFFAYRGMKKASAAQAAA